MRTICKIKTYVELLLNIHLWFNVLHTPFMKVTVVLTWKFLWVVYYSWIIWWNLVYLLLWFQCHKNRVCRVQIPLARIILWGLLWVFIKWTIYYINIKYYYNVCLTYKPFFNKTDLWYFSIEIVHWDLEYFLSRRHHQSIFKEFCILEILIKKNKNNYTKFKHILKVI